MHSRIIEARESKDKLCGLKPDELYELDCVKEFADYVRYTDKEEDPAYYLSRPGLYYDSEDRSLTIVDKKKFFEGRYEKLIDAAEKLSKITLDEFVNDSKWELIWNIQHYYDDTTEVHLCGLDYYGEIPFTLYEWVRAFDEGTKIYIGNVLDYHY